MARTIELLTAKEIEHLKAPGMHRVDAGLIFRSRTAFGPGFTATPSKGKARWSGLGSYPELSLARGKLKDEQAEIRAGVDPVRQAAKARERMARRRAELKRLGLPAKTKGGLKELSVTLPSLAPGNVTPSVTLVSAAAVGSVTPTALPPPSYSACPRDTQGGGGQWLRTTRRRSSPMIG